MLNWNRIQDSSTYDDERYDLLALLEGVTRDPYVDTVGDPTIGIGFNLVYNLAPVLQAMVGKAHFDIRLYNKLAAQVDRTYVPGQDELLSDRLDKVMADWHQNHDAGVPKTFNFSSSRAISRALDFMAPIYDDMIDGWLSAIPESSERAALFSLAWNAPSLLGPKLRAAIDAGDRAEAWYEIRYNSNGNEIAGLANRRYVEAETFGLYDKNDKARFAEAEDVGRMFAAHRTNILGYEDRYDPDAAGQIKGVASLGSIGEAMVPAIAAVLAKFGLSATLKVEELLVASDKIRDINGDGTAFDRRSNDADLLLGSANVNSLVGGAGKDILIGRTGNDLLRGGSGDDLFVFVSKKDGLDTILDFRPGHDLVDLSELGALTFLNDKGQQFSGAGDEVRWFQRQGDTFIAIDLAPGKGADLEIRLDGILTIAPDDLLL